MATRKQPQDRKPKRRTVAADPNNPRLHFQHRGSEYDVTLRDLTPLERNAFRKELGVTLPRALMEPDTDTVAGIIWLLDRRENPALTFEESAAEFDETTLRHVTDDGEVVDVTEADPHPEADGGSS